MVWEERLARDVLEDELSVGGRPCERDFSLEALCFCLAMGWLRCDGEGPCAREMSGECRDMFCKSHAIVWMFGRIRPNGYSLIHTMSFNFSAEHLELVLRQRLHDIDDLLSLLTSTNTAAMAPKTKCMLPSYFYQRLAVSALATSGICWVSTSSTIGIFKNGIFKRLQGSELCSTMAQSLQEVAKLN